MGLKIKTEREKAILRHEDALAAYVDIKITHESIVDRLNAFDWLELQEAETAEEMAAIVERFYNSFNFRTEAAFRPIVFKAFALLFAEAVLYVRDAIEYVHQSYNVDGSSKRFRNATVDKFYYIEYWANKKAIPVNYNEKKQAAREIFNLDTIILSILADKLRVFNDYENNKPKAKPR